MYEQYSYETQEKIKELSLWGKSPKEIIRESIKACNRMSNNIDMNGETKQALGEIETFLYEYWKALK